MFDLRTTAVLFASLAVLAVCAPRERVHANFPMEGKHGVVLCETCHGTDRFEALGTECLSCHEDSRPANHYAGDCGECHSVLGWDQLEGTKAEESHDFLPLMDGHDLPCDACHEGEGYLGLQTTCESCHERPNAYHYPGQDCAPCHPITSFEADGFDHVFIVPHDVVVDCIDCHPSPSDLATAVCGTCHPPDEHGPVYGFEPDDPACVGCHPEGT